MPFPTPNKDLPFNIVRVSHMEWGVTDMDYAKEFYGDIIGYHMEEDLGTELYFRGMEERNHHSLVLVKSDVPVVKRLGLKVASAADLDKAADYFASLGQPTQWTEKHAQGRTLHTRDPFGVPLELFYKMDWAADIMQKYPLYHGSRVTRIDHCNMFHNNVNAAVDFYVKELGFRITETTVANINDPASPQVATWVHRKGGVHDLAFTNGTGPRMHHLGIYNATAHDIINFCDLLATSGHTSAFERGPGRHGISNAFFLYIRDQDGFRTELFASDYLTVDPDLPPRVWDLKDPQRQTLWGQAAPRSWFEEGMPFAGCAQQASELDITPIIAPD